MFNWLRDWRLAMNASLSLAAWWAYGSLLYWFAAAAPATSLLSREVLGVGFLTSVVPALRERLFVRPPGDDYHTKQVQAGLLPDRRRSEEGP